METAARSRRRRRKPGRLAKLFEKRWLIVVIAWVAGFVVVVGAMLFIIDFMDLV